MIEIIEVKGIRYIHCCGKTQFMKATLRPKTIKHLERDPQVILR